MIEADQYFTLIGQLDPKLRLSYLPLFRKSRKYDFRDKQSDFHARLLDKKGKELVVVPVAYARYCSGTGTNNDLAVRAYLPYYKQTREIIFYFRNKNVHVLKVAKKKPRVKWDMKFDKKLKGKIKLKWNIEYEGSGPLEFVVQFSNDGGETFRRLGDRTNKRWMKTDFSILPGGTDCRLRVVVTDGYHNAEDISTPFSVELLPIETTIISPIDNSVLPVGYPALLVGKAYFLENRELLDGNSLSWSSSLQGRLGEGAAIQVQLTPGEHMIFLHGEAGKRSTADRVKLNVK